MQENFSYLQVKHLRPNELGFNLCLAFLAFVAVLILIPYTSDFSAAGLYFLAASAALTLFFIGRISGYRFWLERVRRTEVAPYYYRFQDCPAPQRHLSHNYLCTGLGRQSFTIPPVLVGFSELNGEGLWIEHANLRQGAAIFSKDELSHQRFLSSILIQHLLIAGNSGLLVLDLESENDFLGKMQDILKATGRSEDLIILAPDKFTHFFNPFSSQHSTEQKARSLILLTNLLINRSTSGQSFGAETQDFFYRLVRCLDNYNSDWSVLHLAELLNNFTETSRKLRSFFELKKLSQGMLDLSHLENFFREASGLNETGKIIKLISHGFSQMANSPWGKVLSGQGENLDFRQALESGRIIYILPDKLSKDSVSEAVTGLILEELKNICTGPYKAAAGNQLPTMITVLANPLTSVSNFEALDSLAESPSCSLLFSGGLWQNKFKYGQSEIVRKRLLSISSMSFFKFLLGFNADDNFASLLENLSELLVSDEDSVDSPETSEESSPEANILSCQLIAPDAGIPVFSPLVVNFED